MNHFTDRKGYNAIAASPTWRFRASTPPGGHPFGAYFTNLAPDTVNLALKLRIPKDKLGYVFVFVDLGDLLPIAGGRGKFIFYLADDYLVIKERQIYHGESAQCPSAE
ncbi:MAG: hypothetical protein HY000_10975 [Planctomycetes bacterium]|nr:hypothetical protein [Planctomycetota bacterium]